MYWVKDADGGYEVLDGQQRTISLCQYVQGDFSIDHQGFANLTDDERRQSLDYPLMVYICERSDREKLDWFRIINIAGERLTDQELRNAVYAGEWLYEAKKYFSKTGCPAAQIADKYLAGSAIRQDYLETALGWIAAKEEEKMATTREYREPSARRKAELNPSCYRTLAAFRKAVANGTVDASKGCRTMGEYHWSLEHGKV